MCHNLLKIMEFCEYLNRFGKSFDLLLQYNNK